MSLFKNYLKTSIYILNKEGKSVLVRKPFTTKAIAEEQYAEACANSSHANLQKLTVQGTPRGLCSAMYVLGQNKDVDATSEDVFGNQVERITFETITEQVGAL